MLPRFIHKVIHEAIHILVQNVCEDQLIASTKPGDAQRFAVWYKQLTFEKTQSIAITRPGDVPQFAVWYNKPND